MSDLTTRLRALGIEPGEAACDYELRAQESNLIPRLSCDAALDELVTALEEEHDLRLRVKAEADRVCSLEQGAAECAEKRVEQAEADLMFRTEQRDDILKRLEQAEAERNALQHIIDCADTPLMRDVMAELDELRAEVREWMCEACNTVYPGPPAPGLKCVRCPTCGGFTAPLRSVEKRRVETKLTRAETAFGILSDLHPDEAQEAWRKAGELGGGGA